LLGALRVGRVARRTTPVPLRIGEGVENMKQISTVIWALALSAGAQGVSAQAPSDLIAGQVVKVDQSARKITIKHGPITKLGMDEGMTMVFKAQDPAMLNSVRAGNKIKFDAEQVNGQYIVTKIEKSK
jgi:Cu(I)/Ag(I) efflux system periplasmic protein CusF